MLSCEIDVTYHSSMVSENSNSAAPWSDHECLTVEVDDIPIHLQLIMLEKQCYVWVSAGTPRMTSLVSAVPTPQASSRRRVETKSMHSGVFSSILSFASKNKMTYVS